MNFCVEEAGGHGQMELTDDGNQNNTNQMPLTAPMPDASDPAPLPWRIDCAVVYGRRVMAERMKTAAQRRFRPTSLLSPKRRLLNEVACTRADGRINMFTWSEQRR